MQKPILIFFLHICSFIVLCQLGTQKTLKHFQFKRSKLKLSPFPYKPAQLQFQLTNCSPINSIQKPAPLSVQWPEGPTLSQVSLTPSSSFLQSVDSDFPPLSSITTSLSLSNHSFTTQMGNVYSLQICNTLNFLIFYTCLLMTRHILNPYIYIYSFVSPT